MTLHLQALPEDFELGGYAAIRQLPDCGGSVEPQD